MNETRKIQREHGKSNLNSSLCMLILKKKTNNVCKVKSTLYAILSHLFIAIAPFFTDTFFNSFTPMLFYLSITQNFCFSDGHTSVSSCFYGRFYRTYASHLFFLFVYLIMFDEIPKKINTRFPKNT